MSEYEVVIPAGGAIDAAYAQAIGVEFRALAPLGPDGRPVLQQVVETLRAGGQIRRVICVAPLPVQKAIRGVDIWLTAGPSGAANIREGLAAADPKAPALVCASDLPLLTPESVADFLGRCRPEAEVSVGLVRAEAYNQRFPDAPPSVFVPLSDAGPVTLGGLFVVHPAAVIRREALLNSLVQSRKAQWRMASLLGPPLLWAWATRRLSLNLLLDRAAVIWGGPVQAVPDVSPLLAYDIDTADDYQYAQTRLRDLPAPSLREFSP